MSKRPLDGAGSAGPALTRARSAPNAGADDSYTALDVTLLKEQNRQLNAALSKYRRRVQRKDAQLSSLRRGTSEASQTSQTVLRHWQVLNSDLESMCTEAGMSLPSEEAVVEDSRPGKRKREEADADADAADKEADEQPSEPREDLRGEVFKAADAYLLIGLESAQVLEEDDYHMHATETSELEDGKGGDGADAEAGGEGQNAEATGAEDGEADSPQNRWVSSELQKLCRRSERLLEALLKATKGEAGDQAAAMEDAGAASQALRERSLHAQIELLRDQLNQAQAEGKVAQKAAAVLKAQSERAERRLDLWRADSHGSSDGGAADGANATTSTGEDAAPGQGTATDAAATGSSGGASSSAAATTEIKSEEPVSMDVVAGGADGSAGNQSEALSDMESQRDDALSLAATRAEQLEKLRTEVKDLEDRLNKASAVPKPVTDEQLKQRLSKAESESDRERERASNERKRAAKMEDDLGRKHQELKNSDAKAQELVGKTAAQWQEKVAQRERNIAALESEIGKLKAQVQKTEELEKDKEALQTEIRESTDLLESMKQRAEAATVECRKAQESSIARSKEAEAARKTAEKSIAEGADEAQAPEVAKLVELRASTVQELEDQKAMNEALVQEVTDLTSRYDEKCSQSARLLKQSQAREDLKNALMQKTVHLVELKEAQQEEEQKLRRRVETAENALRAREEQIKMMDQYLVTAHTQKMEFQNSQLKKDREASVALASASQCQHELDELQSTHEEQTQQHADMKQRAAELAEKNRGTSKERDLFQEQLTDTRRKLEKAQRKFERAKEKIKGVEASANREKGDDDEDDDTMVGLLEFENEHLRKMVKCPILKENNKSVMLLRCGHTFSREAIDQRIADRMRRCPACNKAFGNDDIKAIYLVH